MNCMVFVTEFFRSDTFLEGCSFRRCTVLVRAANVERSTIASSCSWCEARQWWIEGGDEGILL